MDEGKFDRLARIIATEVTRRSLLSRLLGLSLIMLPAGLILHGDRVRARRRRDRRHRAQASHAPRQRHRRQAPSEQQRRDARGEACIPTGQRCPSKKPRGKKGKKLSCNRCCQHQVVTDARGHKVCGCLPNGSACTADTATACCSGVCDGTTCQAAACTDAIVCASGQRCLNGRCVCDATSCPTGCCDSAGTCRIEESTACGTGGGVCINCLSSNQICDRGVCQPCDVCASGCDFTSIQAAIDSTTPQLTTIRVCPGIYAENYTSATAVLIIRGLTLIGAGSGSDPGSNTIVKPQLDDQLVIGVSPPIGPTEEVMLRALRISGTRGSANGMLVNLSRVTLESCTVSDNHAGFGNGGGILAVVSSRLSLINSLVSNNSAAQGGGIAVSSGAQITLDLASRVTSNRATGGPDSGGGIILLGGGGASAFLASPDNVLNNDPDNCRGVGTFSYTGPGAVCTTT